MRPAIRSRPEFAVYWAHGVRLYEQCPAFPSAVRGSLSLDTFKRPISADADGSARRAPLDARRDDGQCDKLATVYGRLLTIVAGHS